MSKVRPGPCAWLWQRDGSPVATCQPFRSCRLSFQVRTLLRGSSRRMFHLWVYQHWE